MEDIKKQQVKETIVAYLNILVLGFTGLMMFAILMGWTSQAGKSPRGVAFGPQMKQQKNKRLDLDLIERLAKEDFSPVNIILNELTRLQRLEDEHEGEITNLNKQIDAEKRRQKELVDRFEDPMKSYNKIVFELKEAELDLWKTRRSNIRLRMVIKDYSILTCFLLKEELRYRLLPTSGRKADLVERLQNDDSSAYQVTPPGY